MLSRTSSSVIAMYVAAAVLVALTLMIIIEFFRLYAGSRQPRAHAFRHARRLPLFEDRIRDAFQAPVEQYGEIFTSYTIWRKDRETQLELFSGDPWLRLNEFTRSIVVRHLWRALERLANGSVVIVDSPPQRWSKEVDATFDDQGIDPWGTPQPFGSTSGPQYIKDR